MRIATLILSSLVLPLSAQQKTAAPIASQVRPVPDESVRQNSRLAANLSPSAKVKVQSVAASLESAIKQQPTITTAQLQSKARASVAQTFPSLRGVDIDAVVFVVLMQCAQDQQSDLQQAMNTTQQNVAAKQRIRNTQQSSTTQSAELTDIDSMRLQMLMDQRSKLLEAVSNVMKSASDTQSSIIANLK